MATKKSTQSQAEPNNVFNLPVRPAPAIDVKKLLLSGQIDPTVLLPLNLQKAIDARARVLSNQAYELCKEHLQRRVAYRSVSGYPIKQVDISKALSVIAQGGLGEALVHEYTEKIESITKFAQFASLEIMRLDKDLKAAQAAIKLD